MHITTDELLITYGLGSAAVHTTMAMGWVVKKASKTVTAEKRIILKHHAYHHKTRLKRCTADQCPSL